MTRHSKNTNTKPFFTSAERSKLKYGTKVTRIGSESLVPFDSCCLCLQTAQRPVITPHGYIYCKEHILENILAQKKEIKKKKEVYEQELKIQKIEEQIQQQEVEKKKKEEFEKIVQSVKHEEQKKNSNFWVPNSQEEKESSKKKIEAPSEEILDPSCSKPFKIKQLLALELEESSESKKSQCPCCKKTFEGGLKGFIMKRCGHSICIHCLDKFTLKDMKCFSCEGKISSKKDVIEVQANETGFSSSAKDKALVKTWEPQMTIS